MQLWSDALRQGQMSIMESIHHLSLGILDFPDDGVMTSNEFVTHVPWPEGSLDSRCESASYDVEVVMMLMMISSCHKRT